MQPGDLIGPVRVGPIVHGGHCVARWEGQVVFVRHALPDELVDLRVTEVTRRFARADAVAVREASEHRVRPPCPNAGVCGGCDFQHVAPAFQTELKRRVLAEQLQRLAGIDWDGEVEQVPPVLGSRCRMRFVSVGDGRLGLRAHRSHAVIPLPEGGCPIASAAMPPHLAGPAEASGSAGEGGDEVVGVVSREGGALFAPGSDAVVTQRVGERPFRVAANGFWQAHIAAPEVLTRAVMAGLEPQPGERAFDLFCGVGVFAGALVDAGCRVWGVEGNRRAVELARGNVPEASFQAGDVERTLRRLPGRADLVVLDPPRAGAGRAVMGAVSQRRPRAIAYVACDPAALARDLGYAAELGWQASRIVGYDLFGMTHHLEAVAILRR
ncbi:class I SAM-dependent RNA methyltransferase [Micropruina sonneratiae]|uniref:class I SAM-dependent RNA methyltransferase n=1 Tax=Micropruina sonneratiae TaxID=2986940 RepID=UPI002227077C|nr:TRAM domain-containing protein [Micropruina sp. KQZ13P-5]MCW3157818.1 TRAM domain-containing protein [Micropruina sp. KQZ13P-5]